MCVLGLLLLLAGYTQLKLLDVNNVGRLLHKCMPAAWLGAGRPAAGTCSAAGAVEWNPSAFGHPPPGWLQSVWAFLVSHAPRDLSMVDALPLVPARVAERQLANTTETVTELVPLSTDQTTVARRLDGLSLSADVEQVAPTNRPWSKFVCYRAMLCIRGTSHGPVSVCLSQVGVLLRRLNVGSHVYVYMCTYLCVLFFML